MQGRARQGKTLGETAVRLQTGIHLIDCEWPEAIGKMAEEGITKVKLHKQDNKGLVNAEDPATRISEKKEDPDELSSEDFKKAADDAQVYPSMRHYPSKPDLLISK